jgi:hypothetical protein
MWSARHPPLPQLPDPPLPPPPPRRGTFASRRCGNPCWPLVWGVYGRLANLHVYRAFFSSIVQRCDQTNVGYHPCVRGFPWCISREMRASHDEYRPNCTNFTRSPQHNEATFLAHCKQPAYCKQLTCGAPIWWVPDPLFRVLNCSTVSLAPHSPLHKILEKALSRGFITLNISGSIKYILTNVL